MAPHSFDVELHTCAWMCLSTPLTAIKFTSLSSSPHPLPPWHDPPLFLLLLLPPPPGAVPRSPRLYSISVGRVRWPELRWMLCPGSGSRQWRQLLGVLRTTRAWLHRRLGRHHRRSMQLRRSPPWMQSSVYEHQRWNLRVPRYAPLVFACCEGPGQHGPTWIGRPSSAANLHVC